MRKLPLRDMNETNNLTQEDLADIQDVLQQAVQPERTIDAPTAMGAGLYEQMINVTNGSGVYENLTTGRLSEFFNSLRAVPATPSESILNPQHNDETFDEEMLEDFDFEELSEGDVEEKNNPTEKTFIEESRDKLKEILTEYYPNLYDYYEYKTEEWQRLNDISNYKHDMPNNLNYDYVVIKYPEITITNSLGHKHNITGLYVMIAVRFSSNKVRIYNNIYGFRDYLSKAEKDSNYRHSHLSGGSCSHFSIFCLGSSEISNLLLELNNEFTYESFELFLNQLDAYVKWESKEGGPYKHISNIKESGSSDNLNSLTSRQQIECLTEFFSKNETIPLELSYYINNIPEFKLDKTNPEFDKCLDKCNFPKVYYHNGNYYNQLPASINNDGEVVHSSNVFKFNGNQVSVVIKNSRQDKVVGQLVPHPDVKGIVFDKIVQILNIENEKIRGFRS